MHRNRNYPANYRTILITQQTTEQFLITQQTTEQFLITEQSTELSAEFQITTNELCIEFAITLQTTE